MARDDTTSHPLQDFSIDARDLQSGETRCANATGEHIQYAHLC
jgi:hypothetical protein